jgi:tetratricopeptide (TPR) repeat protein
VPGSNRAAGILLSAGSPLERALVAMDSGEYEDAIALLSQAIDAGESAALALSKRGVCRVRSGDRIGAAKDFAGALDRDPRCVSAIVNLGNLALEANMLQEARTRYEAALRIDDRSATAHHNLGIVHRREGRIAESVRELRIAATLETHPRKVMERLKDVWRRKRI